MRTDIGAALILVWALIAAVLGDMTFPGPAAAWTPLVSRGLRCGTRPGAGLMNKEMIVSSNDHETMVAILEDDQVVELFIERERNRGVVGNIYKGRVSKVLPGMQSAFVDLGLERDGFLYVTDVVSTTDQFDQLEASDGEAPVAADVVQPSVEVPGDAVAAELAGELPHDPENGLDHGHDAGLIEEPGDEGDHEPEPAPEPVRAAVPVAAAVPVTPVKTRPEKPADRPTGELTIDQLLKEGQEVVVQVVKEPLGTKGARITCHASIPGRFLVFMPTVDHVGVSRKIESRDERARLRGIVRQFREQHNFTGGVIIRTAASGRPEADILGDLNDFHQIWQEIRHKLEATRAPSAVYREQSLVAKLLRDLLTEEYQTIRIDSLSRVPQGAAAGRADHADAAAAREAVHEGLSDLRGVRRPQTRSTRRCAARSGSSRAATSSSTRPRRWSRSTSTPAATSARRPGGSRTRSSRPTSRRRKEIVRQLRLRDLGGIIVLDFIDMEERKNRQKVFAGRSSRSCAATARRRRRSRSPSSG